MAIQSQTRAPSVVTNFADGYGVGAWTAPSGANLAKVESGGGITEQLRLAGFGFSIPTGATIKGYRIDLSRKASQYSCDFQVLTETVKLLKGGALHGSNAGNASHWPVSPATLQLGSDSSKFGTSFVPADVNASDFGLSLSANVASPEGAFGDATVIGLELTVFFE